MKKADREALAKRREEGHMTDVSAAMLRIIGASLHGSPCGPVPPEEWSAVFGELCDQAVQCIPAASMNSLGLKGEDALSYLQVLTENLRRCRTVMNEQKRALECLDRAGIPAAVLKGAASAMYYPHPEHRCMGDIDLIVPGSRFEEAFHALSACGYTPEQTPDAYDRHIGFASPSGIEVELHDRFSAGGSAEQNAALDRYILGGIEKRVYRNTEGYSVPVLPAFENGLVLLSHINQHLCSGLGLRQIIDWAMYVERELDDALWERFAPAAEEIGLKRLALAVTRMCAGYLGLKTDAVWFLETEDTEIGEQLMEYILSHGDFSRVDRTGATSINVIRLLKSPAKALRRAQQRGLREWKLCGKYPVLKPFAWMYQLLSWARNGLKQGVGVSSLREYASREQQETEFLNRLGVTRHSL